MKLVIEIDLESDDHDGMLLGMTEYLVDTVKGFTQSIGHNVNVRRGAHAKIGWVEELRAGCIFEGARKSATGPISLRVGYASSDFDTDNWARKYKNPDSVAAVEYDPEAGKIVNEAVIDVEAVEPPAVHD